MVHLSKLALLGACALLRPTHALPKNTEVSREVPVAKTPGAAFSVDKAHAIPQRIGARQVDHGKTIFWEVTVTREHLPATRLLPGVAFSVEKRETDLPVAVEKTRTVTFTSTQKNGRVRTHTVTYTGPARTTKTHITLTKKTSKKTTPTSEPTSQTTPTQLTTKHTKTKTKHTSKTTPSPTKSTSKITPAQPTTKKTKTKTTSKTTTPVQPTSKTTMTTKKTTRTRPTSPNKTTPTSEPTSPTSPTKTTPTKTSPTATNTAAPGTCSFFDFGSDTYVEPNGRSYEISCGWTLVGGDYYDAPASNFGSCFSLCDSSSQCLGFTYTPSVGFLSGRCYLKNFLSPLIPSLFTDSAILVKK